MKYLGFLIVFFLNTYSIAQPKPESQLTYPNYLIFDTSKTNLDKPAIFIELPKTDLKITDYLAIYGAVISTCVAIWNFLRSRAKVKVILVFSVDSSNGTTQHGMEIAIQNPSVNKVYITSVSFLYHYRKENFWSDLVHIIKFRQSPLTHGWCHTDLSRYEVKSGCPITIEPGQSHNIFVPDSALEQLLEDAISRNIRVVVQDALWRNKYSNLFEYPKILIS